MSTSACILYLRCEASRSITCVDLFTESHTGRDTVCIVTRRRAERPWNCDLIAGAGRLSSGVMRPGYEAEHPLTSSAQFRNVWSCNFTSPTSSWPARGHLYFLSLHLVGQTL